jgi:hypothetical protein
MATETTKLAFVEGAAAATPAAGRAVIYAKADGLMYSKDDAGAETLMSSGPAGSGIAATIFDAKGDIIAATAADTAARLAVGASNGMVLVVASGESTGLKWAWPPGHEFDYSQITSPVTVSGTAETSAGSTLVITGNAATYDGDPVILEFFSPAVTTASDAAGRDIRMGLYESTTFLGRLGLAQKDAAGTQDPYAPWFLGYRFTPTAGSHTYLLRAMRTGANATIQAGAAGATNYVPAYMRIIKA